MTEHEQLKQICDVIGYRKNIRSKGIYYTDGLFLIEGDGYIRKVDVREIIFTPEFMEKYYKYISNNGLYEINFFEKHLLWNNLNNPIDYLFNLIQMNKDTTDKCRLEFVDGYLTCTYNHKIGEECLMHRCDYCNELKCKCYT